MARRRTMTIPATQSDLQPATAPEDGYMTAKTVRQFLDVPDRTLRRWISAGRFPPPDLRIGISLRWRRSTVLRWVGEKTVG